MPTGDNSLVNKNSTDIPFDLIGIIYNPKSTGNAPGMAKRLYKRLTTKLPTIPISIQKTQHAGHAEELAYDLAAKTPNALIISVSGDGGYHEVINGALRATVEHRVKPICAVYGAGNANDHRSALKENPLIRGIVAGKISSIDLLRVEITDAQGRKSVRLAHSYLGLGITPAVALELNRHELNRFRETALVAKTCWGYKPFTITVDGQKRQLDSLVLANINRMAKFFKLSKHGRADDGRFEVIEWPHIAKLLLWLPIVRAMFGLGMPPLRQRYEFKVLHDLAMQLDGEVTQLKKGDEVTVKIAPKLLRTIL